MTIIVYALMGYDTLTRYEITFEHPIDTVTPQFVRRMVKEGNLRGKGFIILAGERICYATKQNKQFFVRYLT